MTDRPFDADLTNSDLIDYVSFDQENDFDDHSFGRALAVGLALCLPVWACLIALFI